jgi:hypothetical protein
MVQDYPPEHCLRERSIHDSRLPRQLFVSPSQLAPTLLNPTPAALVVAYAYYPNAQTLYEAHLKPKPPAFVHGRLQATAALAPEQTVWSYIMQIASAMKTVHEAGQALRMIDVSKVLLTGKNR